MSTEQEQRIRELEAQLASSREIVDALKQAAENRESQPDSDQIAVQKAMANLENTIRLRSKALAESEAMYRSLFDHSPLMALKIGPDFRIREVNKTCRRSLTIRDGSPIGESLLEIFARSAQKRVLHVLEAGQGQEHEVQLRDRRWVDLTAARIPAHDEIQVLMRDVTKQRELEEKLRQSQKMEAIGQLAGGIAHDFNNLLCGIMGYTELLAEEPVADVRADYVEEILATCERAAELISRLLAFSRRGRKENKPVDMHEIIQHAIGLVNRTIDRRIVIEMSLDAESAIVMGDISQLESAILNLSLNARDAMPQGGTLRFETRTIWLDESSALDPALDPGAYLELLVLDTGSGIQKEHLDRIFDPFFTTKPTGHGTGLGLAAVYGTIRSHEGRILVQSKLGSGTQFHIYLPLATRSLDLEPAVEEAASASGHGHILVVDDEAVVRDAAALMLEGMGYRVSAVDSGKAALQLLGADPMGFDLVLLDFVMPGMHGADVLPLIKKLRTSLPVLVTSGFSSQMDETLAKVGGDGFLSKPFSSRALAKAVRSALQASMHRSR